MNDTRNSLKREELQSTPIAEEQEAGPVVGEPAKSARVTAGEGGYNYYSGPVPLIFVSAGINPGR